MKNRFTYTFDVTGWILYDKKHGCIIVTTSWYYAYREKMKRRPRNAAQIP
jgi:hypothetical protein